MKRDIELEATLVAKYAVVVPVLDERSRRRWAAAESLAIGYGGDAVVSSATGLARETIRKGRREIARDEAPTDRIRRPGGGRPRIQQDQPGIQAALEALVDRRTRGRRRWRRPSSPAWRMPTPVAHGVHTPAGLIRCDHRTVADLLAQP